MQKKTTKLLEDPAVVDSATPPGEVDVEALPKAPSELATKAVEVEAGDPAVEVTRSLSGNEVEKEASLDALSEPATKVVKVATTSLAIVETAPYMDDVDLEDNAGPSNVFAVFLDVETKGI